MTKQNNKTVKKTTKVKNTHSFTGCRDVVLAGSVGSTTNPVVVTSNSTGNFNQGFPLCAVGLTSAIYSSTTYTQGSVGNVYPPCLRGLFNKAVDFQWYRITRAKVVFVGLVGSTATGTVTLAGYADPMDASNITTIPYVSSSRSTKVFDLANSATKELSVPIPVDSAWKKVSSTLLVPAGIGPFSGSSTTTLVPVNTVGDLCFGAFTVSVTGTASSVQIGNLYIDYDVEFKGVVDSAVNA